MKDRFRVAIIVKGFPQGKNFSTKEEADTWILEKMNEPDGVKYYRVLDRELKRIIETERGVRR